MPAVFTRFRNRHLPCCRGYYLSAEYLIGRHMQNAIANLDLEQPFKDGEHMWA